MKAKNETLVGGGKAPINDEIKRIWEVVQEYEGKNIDDEEVFEQLASDIAAEMDGKQVNDGWSDGVEWYTYSTGETLFVDYCAREIYIQTKDGEYIYLLKNPSEYRQC